VLLHTASVYTLRSFYTEKLLHTASVYTQNTLTQSAFTHGKRLHTQKLLHREAFTHSKRKLLHTKSFTHSKLLQKKVFTQRSFLVYNDSANWSSKTGWISAPKGKKHDFEALFKRILKGKSPAPKLKIC